MSDINPKAVSRPEKKKSACNDDCLVIFCRKGQRSSVSWNRKKEPFEKFNKKVRIEIWNRLKPSH